MTHPERVAKTERDIVLEQFEARKRELIVRGLSKETADEQAYRELKRCIWGDLR